jgi:GNAT superfamily N-acetyltransferase
MIEIEIDIKLARDAEKEKAFIYNSWLKSYGKSTEARRMTARVYFLNFEKIIDDIFSSNAYVALALNPDDTDQILGYVVFNWDEELGLSLFHYVYVKEAFRKLGIAKKLVEQVHAKLGEEPMICTFANHIFDDLKDKYLLTYNPFMRGKE